MFFNTFQMFSFMWTLTALELSQSVDSFLMGYHFLELKEFFVTFRAFKDLSIAVNYFFVKIALFFGTKSGATALELIKQRIVFFYLDLFDNIDVS